MLASSRCTISNDAETFHDFLGKEERTSISFSRSRGLESVLQYPLRSAPPLCSRQPFLHRVGPSRELTCHCDVLTRPHPLFSHLLSRRKLCCRRERPAGEHAPCPRPEAGQRRGGGASLDVGHQRRQVHPVRGARSACVSMTRVSLVGCGYPPAPLLNILALSYGIFREGGNGLWCFLPRTTVVRGVACSATVEGTLR